MAQHFTDQQIADTLALLESKPEDVAPVANLDDLIAEARKNLGVTTDDSGESENVEASDPDTVNVLWIEAERLKAQINTLTKARADITKTLEAITPDGARLTVNGAPVFHRNVIDGYGIDTNYVKAAFPRTDPNGKPIEAHAHYWKPTQMVRSEYKR
jgi:hypothetical protein